MTMPTADANEAFPMASDVHNPFAPAPGALPPSMPGRGAELAAIADAVRRATDHREPTPILFLGERGIGKTALLRELRNAGKDGTLSIAIEIEKGETSAELIERLVRTVEQRAKTLHKRVGGALEAALRTLPRPTLELPHDAGKISYDIPDATVVAQTMDSVFMSLAESARQARRVLAVTIDEVQNLEPRMLATIARIVHESAQSSTPVLLALAGLPETMNLLTALPTYARRWDRYMLRLLTVPETTLAIRDPIDKAGHRIDDDALNALVDESAGYPFFIQKYASAAWDVHRGKTITTHDVDRSIGPVKALVEESLYRQPIDSLTPRERLFVLAVAKLGPGAHSIGDIANELGTETPLISSIRSRLVAKRVITGGTGRSIEFLVPLMDRYIRNHRNDISTREVREYASELRRRSKESGP